MINKFFKVFFKLNLKLFKKVDSKIKIYDLKYDLYTLDNVEINSFYKKLEKLKNSKDIKFINDKYFNKSNNWIKTYSNIDNLIQYFSIFSFIIRIFKKKKITEILDYGSFFCFGSIVLSLITKANIDAIDFFDERDVRKFLSLADKSKKIKYINILKISKLNIVKKDLIIMYDVIDSLKLHKSTDEHSYLDKLFKFFYRNIEDNGKLVISTFESSTKIDLNSIIKILSENNFMKIELFFNFDRKRFIIFASKK